MSFAVGDIVESAYDFWLIEVLDERAATCIRVKDIRHGRDEHSFNRKAILVRDLKKTGHSLSTIISALCNNDYYIVSVINKLKGINVVEPVRAVIWSDTGVVRYDIPVLNGVTYGESIRNTENGCNGVYYADTSDGRAIVLVHGGESVENLPAVISNIEIVKYSYSFEKWERTASLSLGYVFLRILKAYPNASFLSQFKAEGDCLTGFGIACDIHKTNTIKDFTCLSSFNGGYKLVPYDAQKIELPNTEHNLYVVRNLYAEELEIVELDESFAGDNTPFSCYTSKVRDYLSKYQFKLEKGVLYSKSFQGLAVPISQVLSENYAVELLDEDIVDIPSFMLDGKKIYHSEELFQLSEANTIKQLTREQRNKLCRCQVCKQYGDKNNCTVSEGAYLCKTCSELPAPHCSNCDRQLSVIGVNWADKHTLSYCGNCRYALEQDGTIEFCLDCNEYHTLTFPCLIMKAQIRNYSYQPRKIVKLGRRNRYKFYMGVELELATPVPLEVSKAIVNKYPGMFYFKSDSTVAGLECVSMPCARSRWTRFDPSFLAATELGVTAEGAGGIHVHVDRSGFTSEQIRNMLRLMFRNRDDVYTIAERQSDQFARIVDPDTEYSVLYNLATVILPRTQRYVALNLGNKKTLEYRIFNSTIKPLNFQKNLDFVCSLWDYTKEGSLSSEPTWTEFRALVKSEVRYYGHLDKFLTSKGK